jgi:hypothetical protein
LQSVSRVVFYYFQKQIICDAITSSDEEKAEVLADFFSSVFTVEVDSDLPAVESRTNHKLESIEIRPDKVEKKLKD